MTRRLGVVLFSLAVLALGTPPIALAALTPTITGFSPARPLSRPSDGRGPGDGQVPAGDQGEAGAEVGQPDLSARLLGHAT